MINQSNLPPGSHVEFGIVADLISLISDPNGCATRMTELAQRLFEVKEATHAAEQAQNGLAAARDAHDQEIRASRTAHENKLTAASLAFDKGCRERERELERRERDVEAREAAAAKTEKATSELKADLEGRLARLKSIAS